MYSVSLNKGVQTSLIFYYNTRLMFFVSTVMYLRCISILYINGIMLSYLRYIAIVSIYNNILYDISMLCIYLMSLCYVFRFILLLLLLLLLNKTYRALYSQINVL